jgi:hypothetical protein
VDECANGTAKCDLSATCTNVPGSYTCKCDDGYTGDGKTCTDVDECKTLMANCDPSTTCKNVPGGYACVCKPGYLLNGGVCTDIDECKLGTANCHAKAQCQNTPGSFTCTCNSGYSGDGTNCTEIDECALGTSNCDANATCTNTVGAFTCSCNAGYVGNGVTCSAVGLGSPGDVTINAGDDTTMSTSVTLYLQEPSNLLQNPGAELGNMSGWQILANGAAGWGTGSGDPGIKLFGALHFMTSYALDRRSQLLDLTTLGFTAAELDMAPPIAVREWYRGGGYNTADKYYLRVELRDAANVVVASYDKGTQASPTITNNTWQMGAQTFSGYPAGVRYVYFEDGGRDAENWAGQYGAAMDAASVVVGATQMRLSNDNVNWTPWQPFAPTIPWTVGPGMGAKVVYVQFQDGKGLIRSPVSDTIMLN